MLSEPSPAWPWVPAIPPGEDELLTDDGEPMESDRHRNQMNLLIDTLKVHWAERRDFYVSGNMFLYFSETQVYKNDVRGPDVFVVLGTTTRERKAWVVWKEDGLRPHLIVELLSESTAAFDRGEKKRIYERLGVWQYILYDPWTGELEGFELDRDGHYRPIVPDPRGFLYSSRLDLYLGVWHGVHGGDEAPWLRWYDTAGEPITTPQERATAADLCARQAEQRAQLAEQRADQEALARRELEERLRQLEAQGSPVR